MANLENSEDDIEIRSLVSDLSEAHKKVEENYQKMEKIFEETYRTDVDVELVKDSIKKLIKDRQQLRNLMEENGVSVFLHLKNKDTSSRLAFLKECKEKFRNLDLDYQETKSGDQEKGEGSNSCGYVGDGEIEDKDRILLLDDNDTSNVEDKEVWNVKNVDPDMKRRLLKKAKTSSLSSYEAENEVEERMDAFDNKGEESSGNDKKDGENEADVEYSGDDGHVLSKDLKKHDEGEDK